MIYTNSCFIEILCLRMYNGGEAVDAHEDDFALGTRFRHLSELPPRTVMSVLFSSLPVVMLPIQH